MLDRLLLIALTPLALAGGTATSWLQTQSALQLNATKTVPRTGTAKGAGLMIWRGADGMLHTLVRINGEPVDMVVDTGATRTILSEHDARRVLDGLEGERTGRIRTLAGYRELRLQTTSSVEIGTLRFRSLDAGLVTGAQISVIGLDWLGLVGPITIAAAT